MRILIVTPYYKPAFVYGGPVRCISILAESLALRGHNICVFTTNANGKKNLDLNLGKPVEINNVIVRFFRRDFHNNYFYSKSFRIACLKEINNFDIISIYGNWTYPFRTSCLYASYFHIPFVISPHGSLKSEAWMGKTIKKHMYFWLFERNLINKASYIHYTSFLEKNDSSWLNLKPPSAIIPNAIDLNEFNNLFNYKKFRFKYGIRSDQKILLFLGRIEPIKGLEIACNSFALLVNRFQDLVFVIAGPDEDGYKSKIIKYVSSLGISHRIIFTGLLNSNERLSALMDADIYINSSLSENFSVSTVEAMAAGLPVIVSEKVGVAKDIIDSDAGIVVQNDPNLFASEIEKLLNKPDIADLFANNAKKLVQKKYSPNIVASQFENLFLEILKRKPQNIN